jgi:hypothetical protein
MSTVKATNFQNASSATANMVTDASGNVSFGGTAAMSSSFLRNRIINGDMRIDQRNAGASGIVGAYTVDRWAYFQTVSSKGTWQQNAGAATPPTGYSNYLGFTSSSAYSVLAGDIFMFRQFIEGLNTADLAWGTASAQIVTLSFWVRSSLTGTFGGSLLNSAENRSYPFTYTISVANTWEQKTVTIAGDTSGTWLTTNGVGIEVVFSLGTGSTYSGTAGAWAAAQLFSATGATSVVGTSGATFYVTGVQLEVGTVATPFERQMYSNQLAQCMRYYYSLGGGTFEQFGTGATTGTTGGSLPFQFPVVMRSAPTFSISAAGDFQITDGGGNTTVTGLTADLLTPRNARLNPSGVAWTATQRPLILQSQSGTSARLNFSAEL